MASFGIDVHPQFQAGLNIEQAAKEVGFLSVKLSEGTSDSWVGMGSAEWIRRGKAAGLLCMGYHYLSSADPVAQARVFARALVTTGVPGILDAEYHTATGDTHTLDTIRAFLSAARGLGAHIPLMYLPRWYWQRMGSPSLAGLPILWASSYPSSASAPPAALYGNVTPDRWSAYGGNPVALLQFTDRGLVAGKAIDCNAFLGPVSQLASLINPPVRQKGAEMIHLPATAVPADLASDPKTWIGRNFNVGWNVSGGWEGDAAWSFGVQDFPGPTGSSRGYLLLASWIIPTAGGGTLLQPVDPLYTTGRGRAMGAHNLTPEYLAPRGSVGVTLNYAAPGGAYVVLGRSS